MAQVLFSSLEVHSSLWALSHRCSSLNTDVGGGGGGVRTQELVARLQPGRPNARTLPRQLDEEREAEVHYADMPDILRLQLESETHLGLVSRLIARMESLKR